MTTPTAAGCDTGAGMGAGAGAGTTPAASSHQAYMDKAALLAEYRGVVAMHNALLGMLTRVVSAFTSFEEGRRKSFLAAFIRAAPFKWLWLFMRRGRLAPVASLRLVAQLLPHFPVRFKKAGGYAHIGAWLPAYHWATEDGTAGGGTSPAGTIMYVLLSMLLGKFVQPFGGPVNTVSYSYFSLVEAFSDHVTSPIRFPGLLASMLTLMRRSFEAPNPSAARRRRANTGRSTGSSGAVTPTAGGGKGVPTNLAGPLAITTLNETTVRVFAHLAARSDSFRGVWVGQGRHRDKHHTLLRLVDLM